ncbi:MAG TPA: cation transporter, partial [Bacteroidetes bacterium]|nr:cation transporter [Bacteroidota bacterium]
MGHEHHHEVEGKNLFFTILLNAGISLAELIGGIISGSISLISDAIHNFSDVLSLVISYIANKLAKREATEKHTFGFRRSEIIAAFLNSATLIVLAFYILYEAVQRFINPIEISSNLVIWLALGSIVVNGLSVLFIKKDAEGNMNMKSAYLHLFGDMMTSIAVLIGGILMKYFQIYWIDPVFSILIALYLLYLSWDIFKSSLKIIMQFTPDNIDVKAIAKDISNIDEVKNIHHIHIWQIDEHDIMFEAHIDLNDDIKITEFEEVLESIKNYLHEKYEIHHVTIQ